LPVSVLFSLVTGSLLLIAACEPLPILDFLPTLTPASGTPTPGLAESSPVPTGVPVAGDPWLELLQKMPYPYTTPLPPPTPTILDGIYAKLEPQRGARVPCRRCPDYLPEGGVWKLSLKKGIFHILHEPTGWRSMGAFTVVGDQIVLFNDPACFDTIGRYEWTPDEAGLKLKVLEDTCQVDRRARSFAGLAWASCQPPSTEAAITDHWPRPPGCAVEVAGP
jgi:hypothetical protein